MNKTFVRVVIVVLTVITSFFLYLPVASKFAIDYGHPKEIRWEVSETEKTPEIQKEKKENTEEKKLQGEEKKESQKKAIITYPKFSESLDLLYTLIHAPFRPALWLVIVLALLFGAITLIVTLSFSDDLDEFLGITTLIAQVLFFVLGALCVFIWNAYHFDVRDTLKQTIADEALRNAVLNNYTSIQVLFGFMAPLAIFIAGDMIIVLIAFVAGSITNIVNKQILAREDYFQGENIVIRKDGMVEKFVVTPRIQWLFVPVLFVHSRKILWRGPLNQFFQKITSNLYLTPLEEFQKRIIESFLPRLSQIGKHSMARLVTGLSIKLQTGIAESLQEIVKDTQASSFANSCRLIESVSDAIFSRFRQDFAAGIRERVDRHLEGFEQDIFREVRETFFNGPKKVSGSGESAVYPEGTKYYWTNGVSTHVVIEQKPTLRTVNFSSAFFLRELKTILRSDAHGNIQLAFPYVVFAFTFFHGINLSTFHVFYRNKPLEALGDPLFRVNLPNTHIDGSVCMGFDGFKSYSIAGRVDEYIAHFWRSTFNTDLIGNTYTPSKSIDERIQDVYSWAHASKSDPLFVLQVPWLASLKTLSGIFNEHSLKTQASNLTLFDKCVDNALSKKKAELGKLVRDHSLSIIPVKDQYSEATKKEMEKFLKEFSEGMCQVFVSMIDASADKVKEHLYERLSRHVKDVVLETLQNDTSDCTGETKNFDVGVEKIFHDVA